MVLHGSAWASNVERHRHYAKPSQVVPRILTGALGLSTRSRQQRSKIRLTPTFVFDAGVLGMKPVEADSGDHRLGTSASTGPSFVFQLGRDSHRGLFCINLSLWIRASNRRKIQTYGSDNRRRH